MGSCSGVFRYTELVDEELTLTHVPLEDIGYSDKKIVYLALDAFEHVRGVFYRLHIRAVSTSNTECLTTASKIRPFRLAYITDAGTPDMVIWVSEEGSKNVPAEGSLVELIVDSKRGPKSMGCLKSTKVLQENDYGNLKENYTNFVIGIKKEVAEKKAARAAQAVPVNI